MRLMLIAGGVLTLAGCSGGTPANEAATAEAPPASIPAGEYEITTTVTEFRSTDKTTPVVQAKQGETATSRACIGADGAPPPELFAAKGDVCKSQNAYVRNGKMNLTLDCTRKGTPGKIMSEVNGKFTADSLQGSTITTSFIQGPGDYELRQDFTARRVGECSAAAAPAAAKS